MSRLRTKQRRSQARRHACYKAIISKETSFVPRADRTFQHNRHAFSAWLTRHPACPYRTYAAYLKGTA